MGHFANATTVPVVQSRTVGDWMDEHAMPSLRAGVMPRQLGPASTEPRIVVPKE